MRSAALLLMVLPFLPAAAQEPLETKLVVSQNGQEIGREEFGKSTAMFKSGQGELSKPQGLACSPQGVLFVTDSGNNRFQAFNHQGLFQYQRRP